MPDRAVADKHSPKQLWLLANSFAPPLLLEAAVTNRVFDTLETGDKTVVEIADACGASRRGLRALLNALAGLAFLDRVGDRYALTEDSRRFLVTSSPDYQGGYFRHISRWILPSWLGLAESVRTGRPARPVNIEQEGAAFFREFVGDIFPRAYPAALALADELAGSRRSRPRRVLDLAAGSGVWGIGVAQRFPSVEVTAVDWPLVVPVAREFAERHGVIERFHFIEGDVHEVEFVGGFDVVIFGHVLHSQGRRLSGQLIKRAFDALAPGGTIAIADTLSNEDRTGPLHALLFAVNMLVHTEEGDSYTRNELHAWLEDAGFCAVRSLDAPGSSPLILATRPD